MSDKLFSGIKAGATDVSLPLELRSSTNSTEVTGKTYSDVTASYWRQGGTRTAITAATLASVDAAHSDGGFKEVDATNMPGVYRFDLPDAAVASGADWVVVSIKVSGAFVQHFMFSLSTDVIATGDAYARLGSNGAGLTTLPWNAAWDAEVQSEVQDAIEANHLDHLLAATYDPASKPGAADALLNELVESDAGVSRFTSNALEQAPSGGGGTADWTADERTALRSILGIPASGTTPDDPSTGILDTIRDGIVAANTTLHTAVADVPTNSEFNARTLVAADYATATNLAAANTSIGNANTTLLAAIGDVPNNSEFNARTLVAADYATSANLAAANTSIGNANTSILAAVADVPTNAEFAARTLLAADYATAANLTLANTSIASANSTLHTAIADVPTVAEFNARTLATADYATASNLTLANSSIASANTTIHAAIAAANTSIASANTTLHSAVAAANTSVGSANSTLHSAISGANTSIGSANTTLHSAITLANQSVAAANSTLHAAIDGIESGSGANTTAIAEAVDTLLSTNHGNSSWETGSGANATLLANALGNLSIGNGSNWPEDSAAQLWSKLRTEVANSTVIVLPNDPVDDDLCHLYGQLVLPSGRLASAISLKLELAAPTPIKLDSGRPVAYREVIARTDTDGYIISTAANGTIVQYQPIARTDKLSVGNASWSITSDALIFAQESFYANGTTLDIATLI